MFTKTTTFFVKCDSRTSPVRSLARSLAGSCYALRGVCCALRALCSKRRAVVIGTVAYACACARARVRVCAMYQYTS